MPYSKGGEKCNLYTYYDEGDDSFVIYGWHRYLAQTFTLASEAVIYIARAKLKVDTDTRDQYWFIYGTDGTGKPIGPPLYQKLMRSTWGYGDKEVTWRRATFDDFPKLPAGQYALVLSAPGIWAAYKYYWRMDQTAPTYTQGKAWLSHNSGDTWQEIPTTDFMFEIWGWIPPPEPPPAPVISNWAPLAIEETWVPDGFDIVVTTDNPVHLFKRWTTTEPLKHPRQVFRRGISLMRGVYYCFVAWQEEEQIEPGDTLIHTFHQTNWPICETRWFYFYGTKQAEEQPSASPIFYLHQEGPPPPTVFDALGTTGHLESQAISYAAARDAPTGTVFDNTNTGTVGQQKEGFFDFWMWRGALFFNTSTIPLDKVITSAKLIFRVQRGGVFSAILDADQCLTIVPGTVLDPSGLVPEDYGQLKAATEDFGHLCRDDWSAPHAGLQDMPLNAAGIAQIIKGGITKFGLRGSHDINNIPDTGFIERNRFDFQTPRLDETGWLWLEVTFAD